MSKTGFILPNVNTNNGENKEVTVFWSLKKFANNK